MDAMAFISRHEPTKEQHDLAAEHDLKLVHVGDMDAFREPGAHLFRITKAYDWVAVVHPALALLLKAIRPDITVCVFENAARTAEGEKPTFVAVDLHFY